MIVEGICKVGVSVMPAERITREEKRLPLYWQSLLYSSQLTQKMQLPAVPEAAGSCPSCSTPQCPFLGDISAEGCHEPSAFNTTPSSMRFYFM